MISKSVIRDTKERGSPTPYVKGLTSGEALRVIIALANNYMEDCATVLYLWSPIHYRSLRAWEILERSKLIPLTSSKSVVFTLFPSCEVKTAKDIA